MAADELDSIDRPCGLEIERGPVHDSAFRTSQREVSLEATSLRWLTERPSRVDDHARHAVQTRDREIHDLVAQYASPGSHGRIGGRERRACGVERRDDRRRVVDVAE